MKGANELLLNEASIIEAIQEYLDARMKRAPLVVAVTPAGSGELFSVKLTEREEPAQ